MTFCNLGRKAAALVSTLALGACLSSCGSGTIGYLYVLGQLTNSGSFGQISGFKIDDRTGNLTNMVDSPYSSGGTNPGNAVVFPGGRYLFVLNKGVATTAPAGQCPANTGGGVISEFLVGGDGVLTFQQNYTSQGINPVWISADSSGRYLYVLDQAASTPQAGNLPNTCDIDTTSPNPSVAGSVPDGDVTVFAVETDTGRLTLIQNQQAFDGAGHPLNFFPVGPKPLMLRTAGNYVYTLDSADESITISSAATAGQLMPTQTSTQPTNGINLTSINTNGSYIYLTDAGLGGSNPNYILIYTVGANGALSTLSTGAQTGAGLTYDPVWVTTSSSGKYLYVVNHGNNSNPNNTSSNITAYTIVSTGQLQLVSDPNNPYPAGSGPVCMAEDPTNQYLYVSNQYDSTVTGYILNANTGQLSPLSRTTVFPISGQASCLVVSGFTS